MSVSDHIKTVTSANREAWQEAAPIHAKHNQAELIKSYSQPGFTELDAVETERLKALGVAGKDVAQIC
ncbi:MAG: hypothetical protein HOH64_17520, partial [Rhodospirillales bacterium]|nr:hypothetical protein [Rhodospirillales bacterium]